jgi:tetratricopeptide (TPR) repeat protein
LQSDVSVKLKLMSRSVALICALLCSSALCSAETFLILPFFNLSKTPSLDWIGESLSESIREALGNEGVIAIDREDRREAYRRLSIRQKSHLSKGTVITVGQALDAEHVIYGSFELIQPTGNPPKGRGTLRITAQILDLKKMNRGPEYMELGALEDLTRLQTHLAWQTLQFVMPRTAPSEQEFRKRQPAIRIEAMEVYFRGLMANTPEQKIQFFTQAARLEPKFPQAEFQLGRLQWRKKNYRAAAESLAKVSSGDDHQREATFLLGLCRYRLNDFQGAQEAFELVARSVPLNEVLNNLGAAQSRRNLPNALDNFRKALDGDSADPDYQFNVGYALFKQGNLSAAAERFRAVLDRDPEDAGAITMLGRCLRKQAPRSADIRTEGLERLKDNYEESAYWQLKAVLEPVR